MTVRAHRALQLQYRPGLPAEVQLPHRALPMPLLESVTHSLGLVVSLLPASQAHFLTCRLLTEAGFLKTIFVYLEVTPHAAI